MVMLQMILGDPLTTLNHVNFYNIAKLLWALVLNNNNNNFVLLHDTLIVDLPDL